MNKNLILSIADDVETKRFPILKQNPAVLFREEGEEILLINPKDRSVYHLNETAAELWNICSEGDSTQGIIDVMKERYDLEKKDEEVIIGVLDDMAVNGLLQIKVKEDCDNLYLHKIGKSESYVLDEISGEIWLKIDGKNSTQDIVNHICEKYDATLETIENEVTRVTEYFISEKLANIIA